MRALLVLFLTAAVAAAAPPKLALPDGVTPEQLADPKLAAKVADQLDKQHPAPQSEAARMLIAILRGSQLNGDDGWFGPAQSRFGFAALVARCGLDAATAAVPRAKFPGPAALFDALDRNGDGSVTATDLDWSDKSPYVMQMNMVNRIFRRFDGSGDGRLTKDELEMMLKMSAGEKGYVTADDFRRALLPRGGGGFSPGDAPTVPVLVKGLFANEIGAMAEGPAVGDAAPPFALRKAGSDEVVTLASLVGPKPLVLVFGNFTCGPFRAFYPDVEAVYRRHKGRATFAMIYVREAHPTDGWKMDQNGRMGVAVRQPTTFAERAAACEQFRSKLSPDIPTLVDGMADPAGTGYSGMPARLYVIDPKGKVAYKSGRGPFGFKPGEMEQALAMCAIESEPAAAAPPNGREAWAKMPKPTAGGDQPLPNWATAVATQLPRTAAAMLLLDAAQRTNGPLDPALRAKMRWVIADANRCEYAKATALFDLKAAAGEEAVKAFTAGPASWPAADRDPLRFARLLTTDAPNVPDELFAGLKETFGERKVAAMVYLAAYGNFQDRVLLGLGVPLEAGGPMPPVRVTFAADAFQSAPILPDQKQVPGLLAGGKAVVEPEPGWSGVAFDELQTRIEKQKDRKPRLPVPTWDEAKPNLPPTFTTRPTRIIWTLFGYRYCPELSVPWAVCMRTMWAEAPQDRVFEESLFWVQTRAVRCNYCMGHCEMLLEVAGLDKAGVAERTKKLAGDDWSAFPPAEQRAFAYARKLTARPWELTAGDYQALEADLGPKNAMAVFWWLCRGLYMTRVSDGFALPLERDNVFADYAPKK